MPTPGSFERQESKFRNWITRDGSAGPSGDSGFPAARDRYHLYVSLACPWAHRTLIMRRLKGLEAMIPISVTHWYMGDEGWTFADAPCVVPDPNIGAHRIRDLYLAADPSYTLKATVPVLWDKQRKTIVNNESAEIIRMFNSAFDNLGALTGDYCPAHLRPEIDHVNARVYRTLNNGVYRAGFARTQHAYDEAVGPVFETLDWLEQHLAKHPFLVGDTFTEADIRLFTTLIRFDAVYHGHFKCNLRRIVDYPALWRFTRTIYAMPAVRDTVNFHHIKHHYYESHKNINPTGVVPAGPVLDLAL